MATISTPDDYESLQEAVDNASAGDTIETFMGTSYGDEIYTNVDDLTVIFEDLDIDFGQGRGKLIALEIRRTEDVIPDVEFVLFGGVNRFSAEGGASIYVDMSSLNGTRVDIDGDFGSYVTGGSGNDRIYTGRSNDEVNAGGGRDIIITGAGNDYIRAGTGKDRMNGGRDEDRVDYYEFLHGVDVRLDSTAFQMIGGGSEHQLLNIEDLVGSLYDDVLTGNSDENELRGSDGNDHLRGLGGNDYIRDYSSGNDTMRGGSGHDYLYDSSSHTADELLGGAGNDTLRAGSGNDLMFGGEHNDIIRGQGGADVMYGGNGNAGGDNDRDIFLYTNLSDSGAGMGGRDTIGDFEVEYDLIDMRDMDAGFQVGNQEIIFLGGGSFNNVAGELRVGTNANRTVVQIDATGNGTADFEIWLDQPTALTEDHFIF